MKNKILQEFLNSGIEIKSQEKLEEYIGYCILNNQEKSIKGKTSYHHILPNKLFQEYSKLKENRWNGTYLLHGDHYYVHWLLTEAIDNYSMLSAFCAMHNKDKKLEKINEEDLISKDEFQKKMERMYIERTSYMNEKDSNGISREDEKHIKRAETMRKMINGKTKLDIASEKRLKTINLFEMGKSISSSLNKEISIDGRKTTIAKERNKKINEEYVREYVNSKGILTTKAKEQGKKLSDKLISQGKFYDIYNSNNEIIYTKISEKDMRLLSRSLKTATMNKPLGISKGARSTMIRFNKAHLIGCYTIEIDKGL